MVPGMSGHLQCRGICNVGTPTGRPLIGGPLYRLSSDLLKYSGVNITHIKQLVSNKCVLLKHFIKQVLELVYAIFDRLTECHKMC